MKFARIAIVLAVLAIAASAYCQSFSQGLVSVRQLGMGGAGIAVADDAYAWIQNPAGLPNLQAPEANGKWRFNTVAGSSFSSHDFDCGELEIRDWTISAVDPNRKWGVGGGLGFFANDADGITTGWGVGAGTRYGENSPWSGGISYANVTRPRFFMDGDRFFETDNIFMVGWMYDVRLTDHSPVRLGLVVSDLTDQIQRQFNFGASFWITPNLLLATDFVGIGSFDRTWNAGAEYRFPGWNWCLRAGDNDGRFTFGGGYRYHDWYADYAHTEKDGQRINAVSIGYEF